MKADESKWGLPDALVLAIGAVASASADLEHALRTVVTDLVDVGPAEEAWLIFEGQSMDWLITNCKTLVGNELRLQISESEQVLRDWLSSAERLKNLRNTVIHGRWSVKCRWPDPNDSHMCSPLSATTTDESGPVYHVERSRYRRYAVEQAWGLSEVESLAIEIMDLVDDLRDFSWRWTHDRSDHE